MSARRILGPEQTLSALLIGNGEVINEPKTEKATRILCAVVHPVGKTILEAHKAYLAGFLDGDGAIMALLERHPGKRFGCRVRVWVKANQVRQQDVAWLRDERGVGQVRASRDCWEWLVKDQTHARWLLELIRPFVRVKARQVELAVQILNCRVDSIDDLQQVCEWADALAALNVRSRGRRQNTAAMIQGFVSRND